MEKKSRIRLGKALSDYDKSKKVKKVKKVKRKSSKGKPEEDEEEKEPEKEIEPTSPNWEEDVICVPYKDEVPKEEEELVPKEKPVVPKEQVEQEKAPIIESIHESSPTLEEVLKKLT